MRPKILALSALLALLPGRVLAQATARVRTAENFRDAPNGTVLGRLGPGTPLAVVDKRGSWLEVDLEGWVWTRSLQRTTRKGFNLIVSSPHGENLRASPSGPILGHLERGTLLDRVEPRPGWLRVKRRGWIWAASVTDASAASRKTRTAPSQAIGASGRAAATSTKGGTGARRPAGFVRVGSQGAAILTSAGGDTMAVSKPGVQLRVLSREGNWARVQLEGWAWLPAGDTTVSSPATADTALTPATLAKAAGAYRGRVVAWTLQFISLEHAEKVRTDFFEGEPYLLMRFGGSRGSFVYVAVPPDEIGEVQGLEPLDRILVTGRIRTGASALTGTPIIDLLSFKRVGSGG